MTQYLKANCLKKYFKEVKYDIFIETKNLFKILLIDLVFLVILFVEFSCVFVKFMFFFILIIIIFMCYK